MANIMTSTCTHSNTGTSVAVLAASVGMKEDQKQSAAAAAMQQGSHPLVNIPAVVLVQGQQAYTSIGTCHASARSKQRQKQQLLQQRSAQRPPQSTY
jgi:uncharacterized ParB-like nuclease family protein